MTEPIDTDLHDAQTRQIGDAYIDALCEAGDDYSAAAGSWSAWLAEVRARAAAGERERVSRDGVMHIWGFGRPGPEMVSGVAVALCPGELAEVANHAINDARGHGYEVSVQTVRSLDGWLREVHAAWAVDPEHPMWHRFVYPSAPWVKEATDV